MEEIKQKDDLITAHAKLNNILRFGLYPEVFDKNESFAIEEEGGKLKAFEFKFNPKAKIKVPKEFLITYPES